MLTICKAICVVSCGLVLGLGLPVDAAMGVDETQAGQFTVRSGGQGGTKDDQEKLKGPADSTDQSANRSGGQGGLKRDQEKLKGTSGKSAKRRGGQAGPKHKQDKVTGTALQ